MVNNSEGTKVNPPRKLSSIEFLVIYAIDSNAPLTEDSYLDDVMKYLAHDLKEEIVLGTWKVIRVPDLNTYPPAYHDNTLKMPAVLLNEIRDWEEIQTGKLKVTRIRSLPDIEGYGIVVCTKLR